MTDRVEIPYDDPIQKIGKQPSPAWGYNSDGKLMVRCICGMPMELDHQVDENGVVTPSMWHNEPPKCDWHVHCVLLGWKDHK